MDPEMRRIIRELTEVATHAARIQERCCTLGADCLHAQARAAVANAKAWSAAELERTKPVPGQVRLIQDSGFPGKQEVWTGETWMPWAEWLKAGRPGLED